MPLTAFTILGGAMAIGVGFGSQALVNNFISGLIMLAERPVRIGERVLFGNYDGVIEDVGFRCTKLRTLTDHLVTDAEFHPDQRLDRKHRPAADDPPHHEPGHHLRHAARTDQRGGRTRSARSSRSPASASRSTRWSAGTSFPPRVFFQDFMADSLNICWSIYWFAPADHWEYMDHAEKLNLRIFEEFERLGVSFAFPSRTVYLANDSARDLRMRLSSEQAA